MQGLGKTIQSLEALRRMKEMSELKGASLVLAPPGCLHVWAAEIVRFFDGSFEVRKFTDATATEKTLEDLTRDCVVVTTYPVLANCYTTYVRDEAVKLDGDELVRYCDIMGHATAEVCHVALFFVLLAFSQLGRFRLGPRLERCRPPPNVAGKSACRCGQD